MSKNSNMNRAQTNKNDEFYTLFDDIEKEVKNYPDQFRGKVVYCNCDDPDYFNGSIDKNNEGSNFWNYFYLNFNSLGLKKVIATHYNSGKSTYKLEYNGVDLIKTQLRGDGDFRSEESIELLKEADIVCTNPPFSLYREYVSRLIEYRKKFLIIGNFNSVTYKEIFPLFKENKMWLGYNSPKEFIQPDGGIKKFGNIHWFTNLDVKKRHKNLKLSERYDSDKYPMYNDYDVINVDKVAEIPKDYNGTMGVPITFLMKYNPEQFEILGLANSARWIDYECFTVIGKRRVYNRIIIKKIEPGERTS